MLNNTTADMEGRSRTPQASPRAKPRDGQTKEVSMLNPGATQNLRSRRHTGVQGQQGAGADPWWGGDHGKAGHPSLQELSPSGSEKGARPKRRSPLGPKDEQPKSDQTTVGGDEDLVVVSCRADPDALSQNGYGTKPQPQILKPQKPKALNWSEPRMLWMPAASDTAGASRTSPRSQFLPDTSEGPVHPVTMACTWHLSL